MKKVDTAMEHGVSDIDALVREEKRLTAVESHSEAWAGCMVSRTTPRR